METTHETQGDPWAWPCPYCGSRNTIESSVCGACRAQLRDPEEDDLFTTFATDNAQVIDPDVPRIREALWTTEVTPEEEVAEELPHPQEPSYDPGLGTPGSPPFAGPFSQDSPTSREPGQRSAFDAGAAHDVGRDRSPSPFGPAHAEAPVHEPVRSDPRTHETPGSHPGSTSDPGFSSDHLQRDAPREAPPDGRGHVTPDENGLSAAVDQLHPADRELCAVPIGVCGALLSEEEVVLGLLAGHLMGHASVLMVTNSRILVANARRWKPLLDQFLPSPELIVHLRHDRDVASLTIVQGQRLTTLDGISDVAGAMELTERIRRLVATIR